MDKSRVTNDFLARLDQTIVQNGIESAIEHKLRLAELSKEVSQIDLDIVAKAKSVLDNFPM